MRTRAYLVLALAIAVHAVAWIGIALDVVLVRAWFYDLVWWPYIVAADSVVFLRNGRSLLWSRPRAFVLAALWSAAFWLFFELVNVRLENWYYVGIPKDWIARWPGVFLSFATVLPGLIVTAALLETMGFPRSVRAPRMSTGPRARAWLNGLGALFFVLPLAFPRYAYPLIWGSVFFLAEAFVLARGGHGLLSELARGDATKLVRWLAAGAITGLIWEGFNSFATARWIYTVPYFEDTKLFEMPLLGFVGFMPFALECYSFSRALVHARWIPEWELAEPPAARLAPSAMPALACALAVSVLAIGAVQRYTLRATLADLGDVPGLPADVRAALEAHGIHSLSRFTRAARAGELPSHVTERVDAELLDAWVATAELLQHRGLGARGLAWLTSVGIPDVPTLARCDAHELAQRLAKSGSGPAPTPNRAEVKVWVRGARAELD